MFGLKIIKESVLLELQESIKRLKNANHCLDSEVKRAKENYDSISADYEAFKIQLNGLRTCTHKCKDCEHSYITGNNYFGSYVSKEYGCALNIPCKDFKSKED